jgi:hypothetical protein
MKRKEDKYESKRCIDENRKYKMREDVVMTLIKETLIEIRKKR